MAKFKKKKRVSYGARAARSRAARKPAWLIAALIAVIAIGAVVVALMISKGSGGSGSVTNTATAPALPAGGENKNSAAPPDNGKSAPVMETMETAKAVIVTVELNFGSKAPSIAEALGEIERRYQPDDGKGRTFAILDAYGEPTPDGKLHMSMHVSSEKPGIGALVFRRTGEILWQSRITGAVPLSEKSLTIIIDNGAGTGQLIDGSNNPGSILDAKVRDLKIPVRDFWPDGAEREVTFIYSACGCPVKVMARRIGDRTARAKNVPVIFPDDPAAVAAISRLMRW